MCSFPRFSSPHERSLGRRCLTEAPYPGDVYDDDVDVKGDCLHAKQGKLPPNAVDESVTELSRGSLVSLPLPRL